MNNSAVLLRGLFIYVACVTLALFIGYTLTSPLTYQAIITISGLLGLLVLPIFLKWHHYLTVACWNLAALVPVLPGKANLCYVIAGASLVISIVTRALQNKRTSVGIPSVGIPLVVLGLITVIIWKETGGIHANALGSESWGAGRYIGIVGAILGYFAMVARPVPIEKVKMLVTWFFLSGASAIWPVLIVLAGPSFWTLLAVFPSTFNAGVQYGNAEGEIFERYTGVTVCAMALLWTMMLRYGIKGLFDIHRPWRIILFACIFCGGLLGGFRSYIAFMGLTFLLQFLLEGLLSTRLSSVLAMSVVLAAAIILPLSDKLPYNIQRALSFLPIKIDPGARLDAEISTQWRVDMWETMLPEVPKYLWRPKGYNFSSTDLELAQLATAHGTGQAFDAAIITGDYHHGLLNLVIPLGIYGLVAFFFFLIASLRVVYMNYRYSDPDLKLINTFIFAYFLTRSIFFLVFYGTFYLDLMIFTGAVGLSLTINAGVRRSPATTSEPSSVPIRIGVPREVY